MPSSWRPENLLSLMNGNDKDSLATRVAYKLNLKGPALTVRRRARPRWWRSHVACQNLLRGQCDVALAGGVTVIVPERTGYSSERARSPRLTATAGRSTQRRGDRVRERRGMVVLKRLEDALADGDHIYAVIRGSAINNDGAAKVGFTAPSIEGQAEVIAMAHALADVDPRSISLCRGARHRHADRRPRSRSRRSPGVRRKGTGDRQFCAIGSLKTNIGHLDTAAGVAGLIKTAIALDRGSFPPSLHFEPPNAQIRFEETPFFVNAVLRAGRARPAAARRGELVRHRRHQRPRGAGGGAGPRRVAGSAAVELLPLSARTPAALVQVAERLAQHLEGASDAPSPTSRTRSRWAVAPSPAGRSSSARTATTPSSRSAR